VKKSPLKIVVTETDVYCPGAVEEAQRRWATFLYYKVLEVMAQEHATEAATQEPKEKRSWVIAPFPHVRAFMMFGVLSSSMNHLHPAAAADATSPGSPWRACP